MKTGSYSLLQGILWVVCAAHIAIGVGLNVSSVIPRVMADIYGAQVAWTPQFVYILKPLGAFMFVLGLLAAVAARNPLKYAAITYGFSTLFVVRALQRLVFREEIFETFRIARGRNMVNMAFFFALGLCLYALHRYVEKQSGVGTRA